MSNEPHSIKRERERGGERGGKGEGERERGGDPTY